MTRQILVLNSMRGTASHKHRVRDDPQVEHGSVIFRWRVNDDSPFSAAAC
jgi:hypothetical protein